MGGKEDKFDKYDEMGQLAGGYDVNLAREAALRHAREQLLQEEEWIAEPNLTWEVESAKFDEDEDCYKVVLLCYPKGIEVESKAQLEYHIDATGNLYAGTPILRSKGKWAVAQSDITRKEQEKEARQQAEEEKLRREEQQEVERKRIEEEKRKEREKAETPSPAPGTGEKTKSRKPLFIFIGVIVVIGAVVAGVVMMGGGSDDGNGTSEYAPPLPETTTPSVAAQIPEETVEPTFIPTPDSSILEMVSIPGGSFQMGSNDGDSDERPVHTVTLSPFSMAKYEVSYAEWMAVKNWAESNGYSFNNPGDMGSENYGGSQDETHPVTEINWYDTVLWCNALSEKEGRTPCYYTSSAQTTIYRSGREDIQNDWVNWEANGYRLPTEAEWEYACRAGTTTEYSFGDSIDSGDANFNFNENGTTPVGSYSANKWGLYDMHGNVWEWCWDWYDSGYYNSSSEKGPSVGSNRVERGGRWCSNPVYLRSASRSYGNPGNGLSYLGFRPAHFSS